MAISCICDQILKDIDKRKYICPIFLAIRKAFDTVDHKILLWKLKHQFSICGRASKIFESYLTDRFQFTRVSHSFSDLNERICGVLKRTSLKPLLFLLFYKRFPLIIIFFYFIVC